MPDYKALLTRLNDGTIRQKNPLTGIEVWTVPGRAGKPSANSAAPVNQPVEKKEPEDYCDLCEARYFNTPPEKERLIKQGEEYVSLTNLRTEELYASKPIFRRIPNLFEIVTFDFWQKNFGFIMSPENKRRKEEYISDKKGFDHLLNVINLKLRLLGRNPALVSDDDKISMADAFFGGGHEMIVAGTHFTPGSWPGPQLYSSGNMTPDEHFQFFKITISGIDSCYSSNPNVKYAAVFQNWLRHSGASFDHLHKQIVAADKHGPSIEQMLKSARQNPDIFDEFGPAMARELNLMIAENDYALAFADVGCIYPMVTIQSKSKTTDPCRFNDKELRGMSDLVHAIHYAIGGSVSCNEEWHYPPRGSDILMPWRVCIRQRLNTAAGFEGIMGIYISPIDPLSLKDALARQLMNAEGTIAGNILNYG